MATTNKHQKQFELNACLYLTNSRFGALSNSEEIEKQNEVSIELYKKAIQLSKEIHNENN